MAAGGLMVLPSQTVFGTQANSAVELGIIGCGGRGNWIGGHFIEFTTTRIVALHDPFRDKLEATAEKFKVDRARLYGGLEGYKDLLASRLDAVAIESPPYFHPEQAAAAVAAGKHVFLAKPVAVDVVGCKSILESGEKAKGKVSFLVDFQTRAQPAFQEAARRVHSGALGAPVLGHVFYHTGRLRPQRSPATLSSSRTFTFWMWPTGISNPIPCAPSARADARRVWM